MLPCLCEMLRFCRSTWGFCILALVRVLKSSKEADSTFSLGFSLPRGCGVGRGCCLAVLGGNSPTAESTGKLPAW